MAASLQLLVSVELLLNKFFEFPTEIIFGIIDVETDGFAIDFL